MKTTEQFNADIAALESQRAAIATNQAAELERRAAPERERDREAHDRGALLAAQCLSIAHDVGLGTDVAACREALRSRQSAATGETRRIFAQLIRPFNERIAPVYDPTGPKPQAVRESRWCLAAIAAMPPVRAGDASMGTEAQLRAAIPKWEVGTGTAEGQRAVGDIKTDAMTNRYPALVGALNLPTIREPKPSCESPQDWAIRKGPVRTPKGNRLNDLDERERLLVQQRWDAACREQRSEYLRALVLQRVEIVAALDRSLAALDLGLAWWWVRQVRRVAAFEPQVQIADPIDMFEIPIERVVQIARSHGARFEFNFNPSEKMK